MNSACAILLGDAQPSPLRDACAAAAKFLKRMTDNLRDHPFRPFKAEADDGPDAGASGTLDAALDDEAEASELDEADATASAPSAAALAVRIDEAPVLAAIDRVLAGDTEAFSVILHAYDRLVAAVLARRLPAQDVQEVAQDTFLRAYRALPTFRHDAPFRTWILKIARLASMDHWRKHYRRRDVVMSDFDEAGAIGVERAAQAVQADRDDEAQRRDDARRLLAAAMERLSPDDRAVISLVELDNVPMAIAATQLGCGISAVKVRAFRARKRLRKHVEDILSQLNATPKEA